MHISTQLRDLGIEGLMNEINELKSIEFFNS